MWNGLSSGSREFFWLVVVARRSGGQCGRQSAAATVRVQGDARNAWKVTAAFVSAERKVEFTADGIGDLPDAPAFRGSGYRHSHVRGSEPQCVVAQEFAPIWRRVWVNQDAENARGSGLRRRVAGASGKTRQSRAPIGGTAGGLGSSQAIISAQTNPASSRAIAAATVFWESFRAAR
jgi:hypothetical protein